ncbi:hypothetical protein [Glycomyces rhizosphaerae]|uniref:Uncharacterized protein n=1 Tax=Glycomyces rhizosphaerae TaxID=2054422 RepID=A0ABV7Q8E8_9ACTN
MGLVTASGGLTSTSGPSGIVAWGAGGSIVRLADLAALAKQEMAE